ncbi:MAG: phosphoribosyl-AMP cyclohydrolase [Magnetococcales bacterium]|nr:phosphoribosyl-AMP cyclohydrolase [Magnetococcales bacterium]
MELAQPEMDSLKFNADGLIPAIAQDHATGDVLMMAWMNRDSLAETLRTGVACYWSRSRGKYWRKGESSGHVQKVLAVRTDCDRDTLLLRIEQVGVACHTGRRSCFYLEAQGDAWGEIAAPEVDPEAVYGPGGGH